MHVLVGAVEVIVDAVVDAVVVIAVEIDVVIICVQLTPFPENPELQAQVKLPWVLEHVAWVLQL